MLYTENLQAPIYMYVAKWQHSYFSVMLPFGNIRNERVN